MLHDIRSYNNNGTCQTPMVKYLEQYIVEELNFKQCISFIEAYKGPLQCFSMEVVVNKWFLLNREKKFGADSSCRLREKRKNCSTPLHSNSKTMTSPSRRLGYSNSNNQLNC